AASIKAGLDAHGNGSGIDGRDAYRAARSALQGDQLATFFIDGRSYRALVTDVASPGSAAQSGMPELLALSGSEPDWIITGVRAEDDVLVMDSITSALPEPTAGATAGPSLLAVPPAHPSVIDPMAPANTIALIEVQGAGVRLQNLLTRLKAVPELAPGLQLLDGAGGAGQLVGWVDDAGVIVINGSPKP